MDLKEPKTFDEQIDKLIEHGCAFMDRAQAVKTLKQANYYRLSAYFLPFKERDNSTYKAGTNFEKIYDIYEFDQRIAILLYGLIEEIEVFIKTQIAYQHSMKYGAVGYLDPNNFISSKAEKHQNLINLFRNELILIFNQPTDKSSAEISPFFVKLPCRAASPPAVTFLDWSYFICRLCL